MENRNPIEVPFLDTAQMIEVDRLMPAKYGIELLQMMENAGRHLARLASRRFLGNDPTGRRVAILAGPGGNGGGALVAARNLHNWGAAVRVFLARPPSAMSTTAARQVTILGRMGLVGSHTVESPSARADFDLIVDGLIGYSLREAPRGRAADLIRWANGEGTSILALDVPSGVDAGAGTVHDPVIIATATVTLALPKTGLRAAAARPCVGELYLADIGVPPELYAEPTVGIAVTTPFTRQEVVRLW